ALRRRQNAGAWPSMPPDDELLFVPGAHRLTKTGQEPRFAGRARRAIRCGPAGELLTGSGHLVIPAAQFPAQASSVRRAARGRIARPATRAFRGSHLRFERQRVAEPQRREFLRRSTLRNPPPILDSRGWPPYIAACPPHPAP